MNSQQPPIKIVIEDEPVMQPERSRPGLTTTLTSTSQQLSGRAKAAWQSEQRKQAQTLVSTGLHKGAKIARQTTGRGLRWLSLQLAKMAERLTPTQ